MTTKLLIITIVLIALILLLLGLKLLIQPKRPYSLKSCGHQFNQNNKNDSCPTCGIKATEVCPEKDS